MTPDMIKTKIMHGDDLPDPSVLPTTGRPVLVTPTGPISMRNMRKEPTQEELVSFNLYTVLHQLLSIMNLKNLCQKSDQSENCFLYVNLNGQLLSQPIKSFRTYL